MKTNAAVSTINKEELVTKIKADPSVQIVNVLSPEHWSEGLIKNSKKIPLQELNRRLNELDKSKEVVTYCAGYQCHASRQAAEQLQEKGFKVHAYEGGIQEWKEARLPLEKKLVSIY